MTWRIAVGLLAIGIAAWPQQQFSHDSQWWAAHHTMDVLIAAYWGFVIRGEAQEGSKRV